MDLHRLSLLSFSFCLIKATRPKIYKKSVFFKLYYHLPMEDSSESFD